MSPRQSRLHQTRARSVTHLGGDHQFLPASLERLAQHGLRLPAGVGIGRIEEIDAGIKRPPNHGVGVVRLGLINGAYRSIARSEGHGPEREPRNDKAGITQDSVLHRIIFV